MARLLATLCMAGLVSVVASQADAGDPFRATSDSGVSSSSLDAMGLGGMRTMSRDESSQIRGQGVMVFGRSYARAVAHKSSAWSTNGYRAHDKHFAKGKNVSIAVGVSGKLGRKKFNSGYGGKHKGGIRFSVVAAGGFSKASTGR